MAAAPRRAGGQSDSPTVTPSARSELPARTARAKVMRASSHAGYLGFLQVPFVQLGSIGGAGEHWGAEYTILPLSSLHGRQFAGVGDGVGMDDWGTAASAGIHARPLDERVAVGGGK